MITGKIRSIIVNILTNTVGRTLVLLQPKKVNKLTENGITIIWEDSLSSSERLMRRYMLKKMDENQDFDTLAKLHKSYWTKFGDDFVNKTENKLENTNLPAYKTILEVLKNEVSKQPIKFDKFVEIGTGNGSVLNYLSPSYPDIQEMIGIDLSEEQTKNNIENYKHNPRLDFIGGDVLDWIQNQENGNMVVLTFRGVLEYLTQDQLIAFFQKLNSLGNIIFFAIEPTDASHNYETQPDSKVYGIEGSFSHNYIKLFEDTGFKIWHSEEKEESWHSNIMRIIGAKNY